MKKVIYLLILFILICKEWDIIPMGLWSADVHFVLLYGYVLLGFILFRKNRMDLFHISAKKFYGFIIAGILLSFIPAYIYHNQGILQTLITTRTQFCWLFIPLLFKVSPTQEEVYKFAKYASVLATFICLLKFIDINLFVIEDHIKYRMQQGEYAYEVLGYWVYTLPIFWNLQRIKNNQGRFLHNIAIVLVCLTMIFIMQNRSTLFPVTLFVLYTVVWASNSKNKFFIIIFTAIVSVFVIIYTQDVWLDLFTETTEQLDDSDYARAIELAYFLSPKANPGFLTYILGNGMISKNTHSWVELLHDALIFNSDVGFIGFWNYFGIIPIIVFVVTMFKAIFNRSQSYYLKLWAMQMLVCALTLSYFAVPVYCFYYSLFFYLLFRNAHYSKKTYVQ